MNDEGLILNGVYFGYRFLVFLIYSITNIKHNSNTHNLHKTKSFEVNSPEILQYLLVYYDKINI
jgi:hypothetical protein